MSTVTRFHQVLPSLAVYIYIYITCHSDKVHLSGVGLEDQLTCRIMPAFCQDILVHSFVKQRKPHVSCSGKEKNNGGLENRKTKVDEFQPKRMKPNKPAG